MLNEREQHAVDLIAGFGLTNYQIALAMGVTENAVREYVRDVMDKIGLSTRLEVAKWRLSRGNHD